MRKPVKHETKTLWDRLGDLSLLQWVATTAASAGSAVFGFASKLSIAVIMPLGAVTFLALTGALVGFETWREKRSQRAANDGPRLTPRSVEDTDWYANSRYFHWTNATVELDEAVTKMEGRYFVGIENTGNQPAEGVTCWLRSFGFSVEEPAALSYRASQTPPGELRELEPSEGSPASLNPGDEALFHVFSVVITDFGERATEEFCLPWKDRPVHQLNPLTETVIRLRATCRESAPVDFSVRVSMPSEEKFAFDLLPGSE